MHFGSRRLTDRKASTNGEPAQGGRFDHPLGFTNSEFAVKPSDRRTRSVAGEESQDVPEHHHQRAEKRYRGSDVGPLRVLPEDGLGLVQDRGAG